MECFLEKRNSLNKLKKKFLYISLIRIEFISFSSKKTLSKNLNTKVCRNIIRDSKIKKPLIKIKVESDNKIVEVFLILKTKTNESTLIIKCPTQIFTQSRAVNVIGRNKWVNTSIFDKSKERGGDIRSPMIDIEILFLL